MILNQLPLPFNRAMPIFNIKTFYYLLCSSSRYNLKLNILFCNKNLAFVQER